MEKDMATHSTVCPEELRTVEPGGAATYGVDKSQIRLATAGSYLCRNMERSLIPKQQEAEEVEGLKRKGGTSLVVHGWDSHYLCREGPGFDVGELCDPSF